MTAGDKLGISTPWMQVKELDPTQWGRLYNLLIKPNRVSTGLYILHDNGNVVAVTPAYAQHQLGLPPVIDDPEVAAAELYATWGRGPVCVFERQALKDTFDRIQRARTDDDDIFTFMIKLVGELADEKGMVIYPSPFEKWRGVSPALPRAIARAIAPDGMRASCVIAVYESNEMYLSLLLGFENGELTLVTTLPPASDSGSDWRQDHTRLLAMAQEKFAPAELGIFVPLSLVEQLGISPQSLPKWLEAEQQGQLVCAPTSLSEIATRVAAHLLVDSR
jgi:hypothetical protein